jgi:hypothetical protein
MKTVYVIMGKSHTVLVPVVMHDGLRPVDYILLPIFCILFLVELYIFAKMIKKD